VLVNQTIKAFYENGVLRPLTPLALPDRTEVQITVEAASARPDAEAHRRQVDAALLAAGLMLPRLAADPPHRPLTDAERDALSRHIPAGRPLSELILEERDGR
jgi:predicted DNA-binding antitoxin AbrB/MazE fold protein